MLTEERIRTWSQDELTLRELREAPAIELRESVIAAVEAGNDLGLVTSVSAVPTELVYRWLGEHRAAQRLASLARGLSA